MKARSLAEIMATVALFFMVSTAVFAQLPPAAGVLPAGYKVTGERNIGGAAMFIEATKPNENFPKPHMDQGIKLEIRWMAQAMPQQVLDILAKQPEDPAGRSPGSVTRDEPCGKQHYHDGVLTCRKVITPWVGGGSGPDLVTWRVTWAGKGPTGIVSIEINNFVGGKEAATGLIDGIIPKITKSK